MTSADPPAHAGPASPGNFAMESVHRADDPLDRHAVRDQSLRHGSGVPCPIPPRCLLDIRTRVGRRYRGEEVGIVGSRQHPGDVRGALRHRGEQLLACGLHVAFCQETLSDFRGGLRRRWSQRRRTDGSFYRGNCGGFGRRIRGCGRGRRCAAGERIRHPDKAQKREGAGNGQHDGCWRPGRSGIVSAMVRRTDRSCLFHVGAPRCPAARRTFAGAAEPP